MAATDQAQADVDVLASNTLVRVRSAEDWKALHAIRRAVLFKPGRHAFEYDENHPDDRIESNSLFLLMSAGEAIGVVRLDRHGRIGIVRLVAIMADRQRRGHGRSLSQLIDAEASRVGLTALRVNAAADAVGYYEKTGWHRSEWDPAELSGLAAGCVQMEKSLPMGGSAI
ncbi:GNAT family N-acetyltransferase [Bosea sp. 685]|uniref:GNAT family N-acetyltransferase n=1 Tax=Bosea sp. 685 TaxID=3080057 RepID=UPI002892B4DC|nr:GNAT family N-acetyltransferase [Bosea sp. 685]WNJ90641.1 GNAT family N-acetyltransferase [Bosea sp. 685]